MDIKLYWKIKSINYVKKQTKSEETKRKNFFFLPLNPKVLCLPLYHIRVISNKLIYGKYEVFIILDFTTLFDLNIALGTEQQVQSVNNKTLSHYKPSTNTYGSL